MVIAAIILMLFSFVIFIGVAIWATKQYFAVNDKVADQLHKAVSTPVDVTFRLKSRGWGLSALRLPFGCHVGGSQQTALVELKKETIVLTWIKRQELPYHKIKLVDTYDFGISRMIVFHFRDSAFTRYGNIVRKDSLIDVLRILSSKGVPLSSRARRIATKTPS
jgi:hypothetical protein